MQVSYHTTPIVYVIMDDFLPERAAKECLKECFDLKPFYESATTFGQHVADGHASDGCEECKRLGTISRNFDRDNDLVYLDRFYKDKRLRSPILSYLEKSLTTSEFTSIVNKAGGMLPIALQINTTESILSRYGKCDFYGWHTDPLPNKQAQRVLTLVYYLNEEPVRFKGGKIMFYLTNGESIKIEAKHNRAVLFESRLVHGVTDVDLPKDDFNGGRFSINYWLGFDNMYRFRGEIAEQLR